MSEAYIPQTGERRLVVDTSLCAPECDCLPCRMCPVEAIRRTGGEPPRVNHRVCLLCGGCLKACAPGALSIRREELTPGGL